MKMTVNTTAGSTWPLRDRPRGPPPFEISQQCERGGLGIWRMLRAKMILGTYSSHVISHSVTWVNVLSDPQFHPLRNGSDGVPTVKNYGVIKTSDAGEMPGIVEGAPYKLALFLLFPRLNVRG